jgi:hypothetical protein
MGRTIAWVLSTLVLLTTGALGLYSGIADLSGARTPLQWSVTVGVVVYGLLGLLGGAALALRKGSALALTAAWAVVVTYVAATAALAYGGPNVPLSAPISGGIGAALVGAGVVWTAANLARTPASTAPAPPPR